MAAASLLGQNPNTAVYPGGVATDTDLLVASNRAGTTLSAAINASTLTIPVNSSTPFIVPTVVTIDGEIIKVCTKASGQLNACSGGRGFDGSTAATHTINSTVTQNATRYFFNQLAAEVKALEANAATNVYTTLGDTDYGAASGVPTRLPGNTTATKKFLAQTGTGLVSAAPVWSTIVAGDVPTLNQDTTGKAALATAFDHTPTCSGCSSIKTITAIDSGGNLTPTAIQLAAADGATLGLAAFAAADFNATLGVITIDYTNGQAASSSTKGFLTSTDWSTFNTKVSTTRTISTTSPLSGGGDLSADRTLVIANAAADGSTKGAASFTASDFDASGGNISLDYTNGQAADSTHKGFLTSADWVTFNAKLSSAYTTVQEEGSSLTQRSTLNFAGSAITCADGSSKTTCTVTNAANRYEYIAGVCQSAAASIGASLPASNAPTAACITGSNTNFGVAQFTATGQSMQSRMTLPSTWSGTLSADIKYRSVGTTGNIVWALQTICVADGATVDPAFNTASTVSTAAQGTTLQVKTATISSVTVTGCNAGDHLFWKLTLDASTTTSGNEDLLTMVLRASN